MTKPYFRISTSNYNLKAFNLMTIGFCTQLSVISKFTSELVAKSNITRQITPEFSFVYGTFRLVGNPH